MREADKIAELYEHGLDGYYVDPEGGPGKPYDWDRSGLYELAADFCDRIIGASSVKPFGVTSHFRGKYQHPKLPWEAFFKRASVLLPQSYWRTENGSVLDGDIVENYEMGLDCWADTGGAKSKIVPMGGDISYVKPADIETYAAAAQACGVDTLHFYGATSKTKTSVLEAIAAA